jgi:hypothetical protein
MRAREPFRWLPGRGYDLAALRRLRARFPRPGGPMRDAWFMAGTPARERIDDGFMSYWEVRDALYDLSANIARDGDAPLAREWFHFLLAQELPGAMFGAALAPLLEALATGVFLFHPFGVEREPYEGFIRDCLDTMGSVIMGPDGWSRRGEINRGAILRRRWLLGAGWDWGAPSGDLSASLFLCLKYLSPAEIGPWLRSVLEIRDPCWRAQLIAWFVAAHPLLEGTVEGLPALLRSGDRRPALFWTDSNLLTGAPAPFLPEANRRAALDAVARFFAETAFVDWTADVANDGELAADLGESLRRFREHLPFVVA